MHLEPAATGEAAHHSPLVHKQVVALQVTGQACRVNAQVEVQEAVDLRAMRSTNNWLRT
jgi:hypothetical protein